VNATQLYRYAVGQRQRGLSEPVLLDGVLPRPAQRLIAMPISGWAGPRHGPAARCVLLGDAAMRDNTLQSFVKRRAGRGEVSVWVPARMV
jgi:hypothetical protein